MQAIAVEAGYTPPTLYNYFKGKQDIYEGLVELVMTDLLQVFDRSVPDGLTFDQAVAIFLDRLFAVVDHRSDAFAFFLTLSTAGDEDPAQPADCSSEAHRQILDRRMVDWLRRATQGSDLERVDPEILATALRGLTNGFLSRWVEQGRPGSAIELVPLVTAVFLGAARSVP
jgi:AcrR family transcriptional regulator